MERYKTIEGMFSSAFAEMGEGDDSGNKITKTEKPISDYEFEQRQKRTIKTFKKRIKKQGTRKVPEKS